MSKYKYLYTRNMSPEERKIINDLCSLLEKNSEYLGKENPPAFIADILSNNVLEILPVGTRPARFAFSHLKKIEDRRAKEGYIEVKIEETEMRIYEPSNPNGDGPQKEKTLYWYGTGKEVISSLKKV